MSELTKEYFEKYFDKKIENLVTKQDFDARIEKLATKQDLEKFVTKDQFNLKIGRLVTNEDFQSSIETLASKKDLENGLEGLARIVNKGFLDISERLDFSERVSSLETDMTKIKGALRLT